jgi:uncharacterized protein (DUF305 family)
MADEETKQLLRELLEAQKEDSKRFRAMQETYEKQAKDYDEKASQWNGYMQSDSRINNIVLALRGLGLVTIGLALPYLVVFGLHTH